MSAPVVMVGLDAADSELVDKLVAEGAMPNLASLRRQGCFGRLEPRPPAFLSMVWPSLINGVPVTGHGWYFNKVWNPDRMRLEHVGRGWLPQQPFWDPLVKAGGRAAILDVSFAPQPEPGFPGLFVTGWQCHDDAAHSSQPEELWRELVGRFGRPALGPEMFGPQSASSLQRLVQELLAATRQMGEIAASLLSRERFDLFVTVLGGTHRGGHYLWDLSQVDTRSLDGQARAPSSKVLCGGSMARPTRRWAASWRQHRPGRRCSPSRCTAWRRTMAGPIASQHWSISSAVAAARPRAASSTG